MNLRLLHRRLAVAMGLMGLLAFAGGAGFEWFSALLATVALMVALFWHPDPELSARLERIWLPLATILVIRALFHVVVLDDDIVIPVVDLLLLLLAAEALRSLDAPNDLRLYALSFALILASTAYRPGVLFLIAFVAYVGLSTVALMVGHLRRQSERHEVREVPLGRGLVTTTAGLSVVILVVALGVFVTFPRVSQGWAGRGDVPASSIAGFSDQVSIGEHGSSILANPQIVLRVEFPDSVPGNVGGLHWRGRSYDRFDGIRWTRSDGLPPSSAPTSWYRDEWRGEIVRQRIFGSALDTRVLFALHPALEIDSNNGIQPLFDNAGDFMYWGRGAPAYTAYSRADQPPASALREASRGYYPSDHFLQLPRRLDPRIAELADSITAGLENRYDQAMAIQRYLQSFAYTRQLPATARETTLQHFLFERQAGHCEYFSTAMVVMLRTLGIQSRNVNGFLGGQWNEFGSYLVVTQNEAHSWVEAWFPGYGWVTFDPTPAGSDTGEISSAWFWPGRILFDGIQHRWNKWVLDYSVDDQVGIFAGLLGERTMEDITATGGPPEESSGPGPLAALAILVFLAMAVYWARGLGGPSHDPWTRMYLQLREAAGRAGLGVSPGVTPLALVERIRRGTPGAQTARTGGPEWASADRRAGGPESATATQRSVGVGSDASQTRVGVPSVSAAAPAARVVELYLRARYGGQDLGESELREMREALTAARRLLRSHG